MSRLYKYGKGVRNRYQEATAACFLQQPHTLHHIYASHENSFDEQCDVNKFHCALNFSREEKRKFSMKKKSLNLTRAGFAKKMRTQLKVLCNNVAEGARS